MTIYTAISLGILKLLSKIWIIKVEVILTSENLWILSVTKHKQLDFAYISSLNFRQDKL